MPDKWLSSLTKSAFGVERVMWAELLPDLSHKSPSLNGDSLIFVPKFFLLPQHMRNRLLMLIYRQRNDIPTMLLSEFISSLKSECIPSDWEKMLVHLLNCHCSRSSTAFPDLDSDDVCLNATQSLKKQTHLHVSESLSTSVLCNKPQPEIQNEDILCLKNTIPDTEVEHLQCSDTEINRLSNSVVNKAEQSLHSILDVPPESNVAVDVQSDLQVILEKAKENWLQGLPYNELHVLNCLDTVQVVHLEQPASRQLTFAFATFSTTFPRQFVDAVLVQLVCNRNCNSYVADLVIKLIRDVFIPEKKIDLLSCLLIQLTVWSEHLLSAFQLILDSQLSSLDLQVLQKAADVHKSFMKKPIVFALQKLLS